MPDIEILSVVALTEELPEKGLLRGQVGTVVENLAPAYTKSSSAATTAKLTLRWEFVRISSCVFITNQGTARPEFLPAIKDDNLLLQHTQRDYNHMLTWLKNPRRISCEL